jgi:hypothetical protein
MPARHILLASLAILAGVLAAASSADARWFGANLHQSANATASCQSFIFFQRVPSCSWTTSGAVGNGTESMVVPGNGTITRVRIKVGGRTGPMRIAILEALRKRNSGESACCVGRRQTGTFTPRRNRITTLKTNIPVRISYNRKSKIYSYDNLFLTMENPDTPIPANQGPDPNSGNCRGGWFPAVRPGQENFTGPYGVCGYTILIRANGRPRR